MLPPSLAVAHDRGRPWTELGTPWVARCDVSLGGLLRAPRIEVPAGVELSVDDDLVLEADGALVLAGSLCWRDAASADRLVLRARGRVELDGVSHPGPVELVLVPGRQGRPTVLAVRAWRPWRLRR